jgi:hypothetical protein
MGTPTLELVNQTYNRAVLDTLESVINTLETKPTISHQEVLNILKAYKAFLTEQ